MLSSKVMWTPGILSTSYVYKPGQCTWYRNDVWGELILTGTSHKLFTVNSTLFTLRSKHKPREKTRYYTDKIRYGAGMMC